MQSSLNSNRPMRHEVLVAVVVVITLVIVNILWNHRDVLYPFTLFSTLIHEIGHSLVAQITGGDVVEFVVRADTSGFALTTGGNRALILTAGYLGTAFFGSLFFYLANRFRWADACAAVIGGFIIYFTIRHGRPEENGNYTAHLVAFAFGLVLLFSGLNFWRKPLWVNMLLVNIISSIAALEAFNSALALAYYTQTSHHNDAVMFWREITPWVNSPNTIAWAWASGAALWFALAFYKGVLQTVKHNGTRKWDYRW